MLAILPGREYICQVFNGARAQQHMPVRLAGGLRECCRHRERCRAIVHEASIQLGEAEVVANAQAERPERGLRDDWISARLDGLRFEKLGAIREVDVEESAELTARQRANMTRALREAATNAIKYGTGGQVKFRFEVDGEHLLASVENEFDGEQDTPEGLGLFNIRERMEEVGGVASSARRGP